MLCRQARSRVRLVLRVFAAVSLRSVALRKCHEHRCDRLSAGWL
jgi:hypothetical protein